jgi:bombesin receptor subtype-3
MESNSGIYYFNASSSERIANNSMLEYLNNNTNAEANDTAFVDYTPYEERLATYIVPVIFTLIFIIGVLGNGCLILIFFRHRAMRNVPNT